MKWRMTLFALLLVLALGGMAAAHSWYYAARDQIRYESADIQGDETALEGLSVETRYTYDQRLFWSTRFNAGNPGQTETDFSWHLTEQPIEANFQVRDRVSLYCPLPIYEGEMTVQAGAEPDPADIAGRMAWDVAAGLQPGETVTKSVRVADYCQILPIALDFYDFDRSLSYSAQLEGAIEAALAIPVPEDLEISLTVSVVSDGVTGSSWQVAPFGTSDVVLEDGIYLTIRPENDLGLDLTHLELGWGVYRIPLEKGDGTDTLVQNSLTNVYPLDPSVVDRAELLDGPIPGHLLVVTHETGQLFLTAVDTAAGQALQRVELPGDTVVSHYPGDDVLLLITSAEDGAVVYLTVLDLRDGAYSLWMSQSWPSAFSMNPYVDYEHWSLAFDGRRLAWAYSGGYAGPSLKLAVFDSEGLLCQGSFLCDAALVPDYPRPATPKAMTVTLTGEEETP